MITSRGGIVNQYLKLGLSTQVINYLPCILYRLTTITCDASWIQQTSYAFFTEVVSHLCFGWTVPQDEVVHKLMSIAFPEEANSLPYLGMEQDGIPIIRPFLLHLLLKHEQAICVNKYLSMLTVFSIQYPHILCNGNFFTIIGQYC